MYCAINCPLLLYGIQCSISMTYSSQQNTSLSHFTVVTLNIAWLNNKLIKKHIQNKLLNFCSVRDMVMTVLQHIAAEYQLTVALYMLFLYSDDGSHFKHYKIPHKITYGLVSIQGWPLNTGKNNKERQT